MTLHTLWTSTHNITRICYELGILTSEEYNALQEWEYVNRVMRRMNEQAK